MATANGLIIPEAKITIKLNALNEESECIEMDTAVRAISVGRRCQMHGYRFVWEPWASVPSFQTPEGEFVDVKSHHFVPHIFTSTALPQTVSTGLRRVCCMPASVPQTEDAESAKIHDEVEDELLLATIDAAETVHSDDLNQSEQLTYPGIAEEEAAEARVVLEHTEPPSEIPTEESPHLRDEELLQFH